MADYEEKAQQIASESLPDPDLSDRSSAGSPSIANDDSKRVKPVKQKRKRNLKDINAPKPPLTGYMRFLIEQRDKFRLENPDLVFHEVTRALGQRWSSMTQDEKQHYLDKAEKEKEKYTKELEGYQKSNHYKDFQEKKRKEAENLQEELKRSIKSEHHSNSPKAIFEQSTGPRVNTTNGTQVPIFTEPFLEYSRKRESELRQLRKDSLVLEEQNALLNKQIDHMKHVMEQVKSEIIQQENENIIMQNYLDKFRKSLAVCFEKISYPLDFEDAGPWTCENIELKLAGLVKFLLSKDNDESVIHLRQKVASMINLLDY